MVLSIRMNICLSFLNDLGAAPRHICSVWRPHTPLGGSETRNMEMEMNGRKCDITVLPMLGMFQPHLRMQRYAVATNVLRLCR